MSRSSRKKVEQTRRDILARAVDVASVEGLEGLTIGRLAGAIRLSKSGLFAHFGSKEDLQVAVVEAARGIFEKEVLAVADGNPPGLPALAALAAAWLGYMEKGLFRGGCFFAAVSAEVDDRPGRVRDLVEGLVRSWSARLADAAEEAERCGHLAAGTDGAELAFEVHAFLQEANRAFQLHGDAEAFRRAGRAIRRSLSTRATEDGLELLAASDFPD